MDKLLKCSLKKILVSRFRFIGGKNYIFNVKCVSEKNCKGIKGPEGQNGYDVFYDQRSLRAGGFPINTTKRNSARELAHCSQGKFHLCPRSQRGKHFYNSRLRQSLIKIHQ